VVREVESFELMVVVVSVQLVHGSMPKYDGGNRGELGTTDYTNGTDCARTRNTF